MSQYGKNLGEKTILIGWDEPMGTFFAQVHFNQEEEDLRDLKPILWLGGAFREFPDLNHFNQTLKEKGYELPPTMKIRLRRDQLGSANHDAGMLDQEGWTVKH